MIELQIKKYFLEKYPEEACGILLNKKGVLTWIPCENIAEDKLNLQEEVQRGRLKIQQEKAREEKS